MPRGIRRHGAGWQASVYVSGAGRLWQAFPLDTLATEMQRWRETARAKLRLQREPVTSNERPAAGSFQADVLRYLRAVRALPDHQGRKRDILLWATVFRRRRRNTVQSIEIRTQRDQWRLHGPRRQYHAKTKRWIDVDTPLAPHTVNLRTRALSNFYTVLNGRTGYNPVREVPELPEDGAVPRGVPHDVALEIIAAMPDRGRGRRHNIRPKASQTKARLRVMYWTGLSHGELMALTRADLDVARGLLYVKRRKKGGGTIAHVKPLLREALDAFDEFDRLGCWGHFSRDSMRASFRRACAVVARHLPASAAVLRRLRPYDFRHSMATDLYAASQDLQAVQDAMGHADIRTTARYAKAALAPNVARAWAKLAEIRPGRGGESR